MRFAPGLLALAVLLAACPAKKSCKIHSDCSETERCVSSECVVICRTDRDCNGAGRCVFGDCVLGGTGGGAALGGGGGSSGGGAGGGGGGAVADAGTDAGVDAGVVDAGPDDAGFDAGLPDVDAGVVDAGFDAGMIDAGNGAGVYGADCNRGGDCASGLCIGNPATGLKICTITCGSESACDQGHACLPVQDTTGIINLCVPSDSGHPCPTGQGTSCNAGICLLHPGNTTLSVCTTPCETTHACPAGFSCSLVNVGSGMQKVCSPVATACSAQGNSTQCISRWCATQPQHPSTGICTGGCATQADCPEGWACGLDDNGPTSVVDRCQPVGQACTVDTQGLNDCFSKTCATGVPTGDYCVAFCMDANSNRQPARCPTGWSCIDEGTTGSPLWVCERP